MRKEERLNKYYTEIRDFPNLSKEIKMTNTNISIGKLDLATCLNLNLPNQKGWAAVEWMPEKGHSRVLAVARTKKDLKELLRSL